jgi:hypothetical protein
VTAPMPHVETAKPAVRRQPNPVRFPHLINVAVSTPIAEGLARAKSAFNGLGYTDSDIVRRALHDWLHAQSFLAPPEQ